MKGLSEDLEIAIQNCIETLGYKVNIWSVDKNPCVGRIQNFDIHMNLCNGDSKRGAVIYHRMFTEKDDLAGRR